MAADVAVVGTGRMGAAMLHRLRGAGHQVVAYNRSRERAEATGAVVVDTAREAAAAAEVVLVSLADDDAVNSVYKGQDGLIAGVREGAVVLEMSTISPATVSALSPLPRGATLLDAPVSGSVPVVQRGELTVMVGGDGVALDRVRGVLSAFANRVYHLGPLGAGATMKLAVNAVIHGLNEALAEALVMAERAGIAREAAYEVFANSAVAAPYVHYKRDAFEHPELAEPAFLLQLVLKDLELITALAGKNRVRMDQAEVNRKVVADAVAAGWGDRDISAIADYLRGDQV